MTLGQKKAQQIIEGLIDGEVSKLEWTKDFVEPITASKARVKNWLTIRGVIQWYINAGMIKRTKDVRNEEWVACEEVLEITQEIENIETFEGVIPTGQDLVIYEKGSLESEANPAMVLNGFDEAWDFTDNFKVPAYAFVKSTWK